MNTANTKPLPSIGDFDEARRIIHRLRTQERFLQWLACGPFEVAINSFIPSRYAIWFDDKRILYVSPDLEKEADELRMTTLALRPSVASETTAEVPE